MKKRKFAALLLSLLLVLGTIPSAHAAGGVRVSIRTSKKEVAPGDTVTFDIRMSGVDSTEGVMGVGVYFDVPDGLSVVSIDAVSLPADWIYRTMSTPPAFGCGGWTVYYGGAITVGRLTCTVDEDAEGELTVSTYDGMVGYSITNLDSLASSSASVTVINHECAAVGDWKHDEGDHWHECECGKKLDQAAHTYSDWRVETPATCTENGKEVRDCAVCARREEKEIPAGHRDSDENRICDNCGENLCTEHEYEKLVTREATCTGTGEIVYKCKQCGSIERTEEIPALEHDWEIQSKNSEVTVWSCTRCNETKEEKREAAGDDTTQEEVPDDTVDGIEITKQPDGSLLIHTGCEGSIPVEIPVEGVKPGHVVAIVNEDGTESIISDTRMTERGLIINCADGAIVKVIDNAKSFTDIIGNNWYNNAVDFVTARGIMNGMGDSAFGPGSTTTRVQVWAMLARLSGVDAYGAEWAAIARQWAMENNVSDGERANDNITRQELVTMLYRFVGGEGAAKSIEDFQDAAQVAGWAKDAVEWAVGTGVMKGNADNTLNPAGNATRAEMAQFFMNFIQNV